MTVSERFQDVADFEQLLSDAESQARSEYHQTFVGDMNERYEKYGGQMFITENQIELLERIVG